MASTIRTSVQGIGETRRDLEAVRVGLGRELTAALKEGAILATDAARPLTPYDPEHDSARHDGLRHIRDSLYAVVFGDGAAVASQHPGAVVHEYGGTIAPRGHPIQIDESLMAHKAGTAELPAISELLERRIDALISTHFPA